MDDSLLRTRPKSSLLTEVGKPAAARPAVVDLPGTTEAEPSVLDEFAALPQPGSSYDAAHSRASNKPVPTLRFIVGDIIRGLPYANYDSIDWLAPDQPGAGPAITIRFTGLVPREAVIHGRNLLRLYDLLSYHRIAWVRQLPGGKDFLDRSHAVITGITIDRIKEMPA